ncbi:Adaptor protein complex large chain subunit BetaA [Spironucleus salmonicida]|uniref:AP complex subunit beta n=1 Tax=Spironucleus salmonicida TaxID=348837 RepID=V6M5H2_9EUKA|nr:Adaptor protein complex large chain subunit BetaA [Spironucleus salmonicida]|eukprot:EST48614.1 Beta adaptin [Spironucleus salmonicida]
MSGKQENQEWQESLRTGSEFMKKITMQEIIVAMTSQRDVSWIFTDVVKTIFSKDLELKKLVYLYLMNFSTKQPKSCLLAVNAFLKDADNNDSSIIRALAIRTMSSIPLVQIIEYLISPLVKAMHDADPYVRKTAAIACAKVCVTSPDQLKILLPELIILLQDSNQAVISNAVASLMQLHQEQLFQQDDNIFQTILTATAESNEWGLVYLLESLSKFVPKDTYQALAAVEKISTKLQHANPSVVINSIKSILNIVKYLPDEQRYQYITRTVPSFITLLSTESPQIQYLTLRSVASVISAFPGWISFEIRPLLPSYLDPLYIKLEKLEVLLQVANDENVSVLLEELKDYCVSDVEQKFVKKCVNLIGKLAIKLINASGYCVQILVDLVSKVSNEQADGDGALYLEKTSKKATSYTVVAQEAIVSIRDVVRCYPGYFDAAILQILQLVTAVDDPSARCALFDVIGAQSQSIENAADVIENFSDKFSEEQESVQLALLSAAVKVFLHNSTEQSQALAQSLLAAATGKDKEAKIFSPDVRERAFFYWRLLSLDDLADARSIIFGGELGFDGNKATRVVDPVDAFNIFVPNLGMYSSISRVAVKNTIEKKQKSEDDEESLDINLQGLTVDESQDAYPVSQPQAAAKNILDDLFGFE